MKIGDMYVTVAKKLSSFFNTLVVLVLKECTKQQDKLNTLVVLVLKESID